MQQNWGTTLRWKASSQYGSTWRKITRIRPKLKQRKADSVELAETFTITKSHGEDQWDGQVAPKYDETDEQRRKMGTNSKMKDETYNEEIDKGEEIKIFKIFNGITKGKEFFIVLLFFLRIKIRIWASVIFTTWIRIKITQNLLEYFFEFMFTIFLWKWKWISKSYCRNHTWRYFLRQFIVMKICFDYLFVKLYFIL